MRLQLLLLILLCGCANRPAYLEDHELESAGVWTSRDDRVRGLIDSRYDGDARYFMSGVMGEQPRPMPVRRRTPESQLEGTLEVGTKTFVYPSPSAMATKALGLAWEPGYVLRGERNAIILLHRGQPATVLPIDPSKPIDWPDTPEVAYQMLRVELERDMENLRDTDP